MSLIEQSTLSYLRLENKFSKTLYRLIPKHEIVEEYVADIFPRYKTSEISHSDFYTPFLEYVENVKKNGSGEARNIARSQIINILRSVGQESKGIGEIFQLATKVEIASDGSLRFTNPLYKRGEDIKAWWDRHIEHDATTRRERERFKRERDQIIESLFPKLCTPILEVTNSEIDTLLSSHNFVKGRVPVTKGMSDICPILSVGDRVEVYQGPAVGSASPKSIVHNNAATSILWVSRLLYIPSLSEWIIVQDGRFSQYDDAKIQEFLKMGIEPLPKLGIFSREQQIMQTLALFDEEFAHSNAKIIFDHLIKLTGQDFGSETIPGAQKEMTADLSASADYLVQIFEWEMERCITDPILVKGLRARLQKFAGEKHLLHYLGTDETLNKKECFSLYTTHFSEKEKALSPTKYSNIFDTKTLSFYPNFKIPINYSMLDCGVGSVVGMMNPTSLARLESTLGLPQLRMLQNIEGRSIVDREEFEHICRSFGKNSKNFPVDNWGLCTCEDCVATKQGLKNYLGPCGWCLSCEIKDDLGFHGVLPEMGFQKEESSIFSQTSELVSKKPTGLDGAILGVMNPHVFQAEYFVQIA